MKANAHPRQAERLAALRSYGVLDTPRESDFDEIVGLAAEICGTAISVVNLIDETRQWFKAETGLGVRETPLETSICSHVILEEDFVEIEDTLKDPRMADNPLCLSEPGLRFYAGALLKSSAGLPIGTLCVLDHAPRTLTDQQRRTLKVLARQVMVQMELRRQLRAGEVLRREVDHRVRNSLSAVTAYARLRERAARDDEAAARAYRDIGQRVNAVALVHKQLYAVEGGEGVPLQAYLHDLTRSLSDIAPAQVELSTALDVPDIVVSGRVTTSVGTFVNEAIGNAYKHAFPDDRPGRVHLAASVDPGGQIAIRCRDDGVGLAGGDGRGLGTSIVEAAVQEIGGRLDRASGEGGTDLVLFVHPPNAGADA